MRSTQGILLASLALILLIALLAAEARRQHPEDPTSSSNEPRHHRHRHRHQLSSSKLQPRRPLGRPSKYDDPSSNDDYDDVDYEEDYGDDDESVDDDDDYSSERLRGRGSHSPKRMIGNHHRYEPRYSGSRYHHRGTGRGYETPPGSSRGHLAGRSRSGYRKRFKDDEDEEDYGDNGGRLRRQRYEDEYDSEEEEDQPSGYYYGRHKAPGSRKRLAGHSRPRYEPKKDWRYEDEEDYGYDADDEDEEEERGRQHAGRKLRTSHQQKSDADRWRSTNKFEEWLKRTKSPINGSRSVDSSAKKRNFRPVDDIDQGDEPARSDEDDEIDLWKEEQDELDNDFYKNDESASLKSYDDIIRRLTDDLATTTTPRPSGQVKRNTDLESHLRRDAYGNLRFFEPKRNSSRYRARSSNLVDSTTEGRKESGKKKSLEEYEEGEDEGTQPDANTDYVDDETDEPETSPAPTSTSTTTTTTSTTTTTQRPILNSRARDSGRNYEPATTGSQYNGYQAKNEYPAMSAHSALKWQYLGTRESVKETRNNMSQFKSGKSAELNAAHIHAMRVAKEGGCQWPRAKVISVRDLYPNSTSTYIPHCAILHRCSDDTGCCRSETLTCEAKHTQRVELYFYATDIHGKTEIEKLSFNNHTECECRDRKSLSSSSGDKPMEHRSARHYPYSPVPQNILKPPARKACRCPTQFTPNMTFEGVCECNCVDHDEDCLKIQHGKGYLSLKDRRCIQTEQCMPPNCTYGSFYTAQGRCPKKKDIFNATATHRSHFNYHPRRS